MAHKVVAEERIKELQDTVAYFDGLISQIKSYSSNSKDSRQAAIEAMRELEFDAGVQKDRSLMMDNEIGDHRARRFQGMQQAYQNVITLFEKPESLIAVYDSQRKEAQKTLDQYKELERR